MYLLAYEHASDRAGEVKGVGQPARTMGVWESGVRVW